MAQQVRIMKFTWENQDSFKMETNLDGGNFRKVVEMDENGHLATLWPKAEALCREYFDQAIAVIGSEMKAGG